MRWLSIWKALIPPAIAPLALWMAVAFAGPGGVVELSDEVEPTFGGTESGETGVGGGPDGEGGVAGISGEDGGSVVGGIAGEDGGSAAVTGNGGGCEQALTEEAQARAELEGHVADGDKPADGADGSENALDKQCGGAFDATAPSADQTDTGPGKSEQSSGNTGGGNANGEGQANADDRGNGAADAPGHNKP
jgi:hypothetical protein